MADAYNNDHVVTWLDNMTKITKNYVNTDTGEKWSFDKENKKATITSLKHPSDRVICMILKDKLKWNILPDGLRRYKDVLTNIPVQDQKVLDLLMKSTENQDANVSDSDSDDEGNSLTPDATKIIDEYSEDALEAYLELYGETNEEVEYEKFQERYIGKFSEDEFVDYVLEELNDFKFPHWVHIDYEQTHTDIMKDFNEENGHYFWAH